MKRNSAIKHRTSKSATRRPTRHGRNTNKTERASATIKKSIPHTILPRRHKKLILMFLATVLLIFIAGLWFLKVYSAPERVFWSMLSNNLSVSSITRHTTQPTCLAINEKTDNYVQLNFQPDFSIRCVTKISNKSTKLTVESIGNREADYQRYANIDTNNEAKDAKYSKTYTLWLKNNGAINAEPVLYKQALNDLATFGNFKGTNKQELLSKFKAAYVPNFKNAKVSFQDGRKILNFPVTISLKNYLQAQKSYGRLLNLPNANQINPDIYNGDAKIKVNFSVDVLSRQLRQIKYQEIVETFSGYGLQTNVTPPTKTVTNEELQKAIRAASL